MSQDGCPDRKNIRDPNARASGRFWFVKGAMLAGAMAACGIWAATLARLLAEGWPRWLIGLHSPAALLFCGLGGALMLPVVWRARGHSLEGRTMLAGLWPLALGGAYLLQPAVAPLWGIAALSAGVGGVWWLAVSDRPAPFSLARAGWLWDLAVVALPFYLYIATLAPSVLPGDSGEFQFVVPTLGIPHPTGYPLYLLLGKLFTLLPVGSMAWRLNLFSAAAAAGAVWAVYRAGRALDLSRAASLIGAALLMVSETFWSQSVIAEKYALNAFFVATTLWLGLRWRRTRSAHHLYAWVLCYGLGLTHHRTMILLAPAYLLLAWLTDRAVFRPQSLLRLLPLFLIPLSLYLLLPFFSSLNPPYAYIRLDSAKAFFDLVFARTYQSGLFRGGWAALPGRAAESGRLLARQFGPLGLALCAGGWAALLWKKRPIATVLLVGMAAQAVFALNYDVPNTYVYYLPVYVWLAVCAAMMVEWIRNLVSERTSAFARNGVSLAWVLLAAALPLYLGISRLPGMDQKRAYAGIAFDHTYAQMALQSVEPDALIVSDWLPATVLWYAQYVEGLAPTAQVVAVDSLEGQWKGIVEKALQERRSVYLSRPIVEAGESYILMSEGPLVQVLDRPSGLFPGPTLKRFLLDGEVRLCGFNRVATEPGAEGQMYVILGDQVVQGGSTLHLSLCWKADDKLAGDYAVTVRLVDPAGQIRLEKRNRHPVGSTYPTSRWHVGQCVADYYELPLPPYLPSGDYRLEVLMGTPFAGSSSESAGGTEWGPIGVISIQKPLRWPYAALSTPVRRMIGRELVLLGYDAPRQTAVGETVSVSLLWLVRRPPAALPVLVLTEQDGTEQIVKPVGENAADWQAGAWVVQPYTWEVSEALARVEVRSGNASYRLPLRVTAALPPVANFGNLIRLRRYTYEKRSLKPGDTVRLTLEWEAVGPIPEPYKVFVHVLGQNGLPIAQQDNEPLNGTYPTTRWRPGERVSDPYAFALPADLPPGEYLVEVGLYRLSDMGRLPVLDQNQVAVDDKAFLEPLRVSQP